MTKCPPTSAVTAVITKDPEYSEVAMVTRRRWSVVTSTGIRKYTTTRKEAVEFCEEHGFEWWESRA